MDKLKKCAIVVTYNRKQLLLRCIHAILNQTSFVDSIIIIDNASTDCTFDYLVENGVVSRVELVSNLLLNVTNKSRNIFYYRTSKNIGGAGGFYTGLKLAYEQNQYDVFWLMDDDGYPSLSCLEKQLYYIDKYDYVMPTSIDIENHSQLSWATRMPNKRKTIVYDEYIKAWGEIMPFVFPFNGCLFSKRMVRDVGYINPDLFIWGDDYEHYYRCLKKKYTPVTITTAQFYHPSNKAQTYPIMFGLFNIPYVDSKLRFVCLIRNWAYINKTNGRYIHLLKSFCAYSWLFLISRKFDLNGYKLFLLSFGDGLKGDFTRHLQYLK